MAINFTTSGIGSGTLTCTDTSSFGTIVGWYWLFADHGGNQYHSYLQNPTFTGYVPGAYVVALQIFNTLGQFAYLSLSFSGAGVLQGGTPGFTLSPFPQIIGSSVTATDTSTNSGSITSRRWTGQYAYTHYGNVSTITDTAAVDFYGLGVFYTTATQFVSYQINYAHITVPSSGNIGNSINFNYGMDSGHYALSIPPSSTYLWDFGDGNTASGNFITGSSANVSYAYSSTGVKTVTFTLSWGGVNNLILTQNITITQPISAAFSITGAGSSAGNPQIVGTAVTFNDQSTGYPPPSSWSWDFGDGNTSTSQNPTHAYSTSGTKTVTLTVT